MGKKDFFVNTNILIYLLNGNSDVIDILKDAHISLSIISEIELLSYSKLTKTEFSLIADFLKKQQVVNFNDSIKDLTIEIRRKFSLTLPDAIIAASAFYLNKKLVTADKTFSKLDFMNVLIYEP